MWASGAKEESLNFLRQFTASLSRDVAQETTALSHRPGVSRTKIAEYSKLVARCYFKQGEWQKELKSDWGSRNVEDILHAYFLATHYDPVWYKAWHTWGLANFDVVAHSEPQFDAKISVQTITRLVQHVVQAIEG